MSDVDVGVTEIVEIKTFVTITVTEFFTDDKAFDVAVIVTVPAFTPVSFPVPSTIAIVASEVDHVTF